MSNGSERVWELPTPKPDYEALIGRLHAVSFGDDWPDVKRLLWDARNAVEALLAMEQRLTDHVVQLAAERDALVKDRDTWRRLAIVRETAVAERDALRTQLDSMHERDEDKGHAAQLISAATAYANAADAEARWPEMGPSPYPVDEDTGAIYFPWAPAHWKPTGDPVRDLVKAGALIAAAIDSLQAEGAPDGQQ